VQRKKVQRKEGNRVVLKHGVGGGAHQYDRVAHCVGHGKKLPHGFVKMIPRAFPATIVQ